MTLPPTPTLTKGVERAGFSQMQTDRTGDLNEVRAIGSRMFNTSLMATRRWLPAWPMPLVFTFLFLTILASPCFGFGAYAIGYNTKKKQFESFLIVDRSTEQEAEDIALMRCRRKSLVDCAIRHTFASTCIAIAFTRNRVFRFIDTDPSLEHARTKVMAACESRPGMKCFIGEAGCDRATASAPSSTIPFDLASGFTNVRVCKVIHKTRHHRLGPYCDSRLS
jgi:Domain of unknown function (DUF4189)